MNTAAGYSFGIDHAYVECSVQEYNMTALKSSTGLRWERRENDEELPQPEQCVYGQRVGRQGGPAKCDLEGLVEPRPSK